LRALIQLAEQARAARSLYGKVAWQGDLDSLRRDIDPER
jgi:hypothetical protein